MRIVFVSSEVFPFAKTGGLADVCGALPLELERLGHEVIIIMPAYRCVGPQPTFNDRINMTTIGHAVKVYFLRHPEFYDRAQLYGETGGDYPDNIDRFSFLCHEMLRFLKDLGTPVDIIHCHDWQTGLIPALLKENYAADPFFVNTRSVLTIHNLAYQGVFPKEDLPRINMDEKLFNPAALEFYEKINFLKAGIVFADYITTVSPQYAQEIQTHEWGCGLEGVICQNRDRLIGILNGLDYNHWDPEKDPLLSPGYINGDAQVKSIHKEKLQNALRLPRDKNIPVLGFVGRLCYQKGLDLVENAFDALMQRSVQVVFMGVGEEKYQKLLVKLARKYPQHCGVVIRYDESFSHMVYAGSDFFLMPSIYEPCGLTQMISLRYGTIPIVNPVGGLVDTVTDFTLNNQAGNGFVMPAHTVNGLLNAVDRALSVFITKDIFAGLIIRAMGCRWTWESSAAQYVECYKKCLK
ncbi:MAG: glycogen synthase GlgA [Candidatus Omnitrophota bacterium]